MPVFAGDGPVMGAGRTVIAFCVASSFLFGGCGVGRLVAKQRPERVVPDRASVTASGGSTQLQPSTGSKDVPPTLAVPAAGMLPSMSAPSPRPGKVMTEDTTWSGEVVVDRDLIIAPQTTLNILPGTVVRLRALLVVQGRLAATGAPSAPVIFSSGSPDGKGAGIFLVGSEKRNILENCRIEGGDTGVDASFTRLDLKNVTFARCRTGFRGQDCVLTLSGGGATGCDLGISLYDSEADIRGVDLTSNRIGMNVRRSSLYLSGSDFRKNSLDALSGEESRLALEQNRFSGNGNALSLSSCEGSVSGNRIRDNAGCGLLLQRSRIKVVGNDISGNGTFGIRVSDGMSVAWGNAIAGNAGFDLYNAGTETFRAAGNWWGEKTPLQKPGGIFDKSVDPHYGRVVSSPALAERPAAAP